MVNPLVSGLPAVSIAPIAAEPERPASLPEASQQVTAAMSSTDSNNATAGNNRLARDGGSPNTLEKSVALANDTMQAWSTGMRFDIDPASKRVIVSIIDSRTGEVLRTVPTDAVIRAAKMIVKLQEKSIDTKV